MTVSHIIDKSSLILRDANQHGIFTFGLGYIMIKLLARIFLNIVNSPVYLDFLQNHLPIYFEDIPLDVRQRLWFRQNGAPAHYF